MAARVVVFSRHLCVFRVYWRTSGLALDLSGAKIGKWGDLYPIIELKKLYIKRKRNFSLFCESLPVWENIIFGTRNSHAGIFEVIYRKIQLNIYLNVAVRR